MMFYHFHGRAADEDTTVNIYIGQYCKILLRVILFNSTVATPNENVRCQQGQPLILSSLHGYITSHNTQNMGAGSISCPWRLEAEQGQVVNITLIHFLNQEDVNGKSYGYNTHFCTFIYCCYLR